MGSGASPLHLSAANAGGDDKACGSSAAAQPSPPCPLPPPAVPGRKTLFLDLDKTLVFTRTARPPSPDWQCDFTILNATKGSFYYVVKRPGVDEFLRAAAATFEVIIFTAALEHYASAVVDRLDPDRELIAHRLYRDSCRAREDGSFVKDLSGMGRDMTKVLIVDDSPTSYEPHKENGVAVEPFDDSNRSGDRELWRLMSVLEFAACCDDIRDTVALYNSRSNSVGHASREK